MTCWVEVTGMGPFSSPRKPGDVGHDLFVIITEQTMLERVISLFTKRKVQIIWPLVGVRTVRSGVRIGMGSAIWCEIRPRSSTSRKKLHVLGGPIDSGYRGELYTVLHNLGLVPRLIREGERYAQVVFHQAVRPTIRNVRELGESERGESGFGSTGA